MNISKQEVISMSREMISLVGVWQFCVDPEHAGLEAGYAAGLPSDKTREETSIYGISTGRICMKSKCP
jgi:hypothetical protein